MPVERGHGDQSFRPTRMDSIIQFLGDRMKLGGPMVTGINLGMRVVAPVAMVFDRIRNGNEEPFDGLEGIEDVKDKKDLDSVDPELPF